MRIISGSHRGRQIFPDKSFSARPTTDFAKENLFNVLTNYMDLEDISALDLFSGTGSISYEFASRGAREDCLHRTELQTLYVHQADCKGIGF